MKLILTLALVLTFAVQAAQAGMMDGGMNGGCVAGVVGPFDGSCDDYTAGADTGNMGGGCTGDQVWNSDTNQCETPTQLDPIVVTAARPTHCHCDVESERDPGQSKEACLQQMRDARQAAGKGATVAPWCEASAAAVTSAEPTRDIASVTPPPPPANGGEVDLSGTGAKNCLEPLKEIKSCAQDLESCQDGECDDSFKFTITDKNNERVALKTYASATGNGALDGRILKGCDEYFTVDGQSVVKSRQITGDMEASVFSVRRACASANQRGRCWNVFQGQTQVTEAQFKTLKEKYVACVNKGLQESLMVAQRCMAINDGMASTTNFKGGNKLAVGPAYCHAHDGESLDYPSCAHFAAWYTGLMATETGLKTYNEGAKVVTGMKAQNQAAQAIKNGEGQEAGLDASKKVTTAAADAEGRLKVFYMAKAGAIGAQLAMVMTPSKIGSKCRTGCCELFDKSINQGGFGSKADWYFPNQSMKTQLTAELIKAGGDAALAAMKEAELKRQANAMQKIKEQMTAPEDGRGEGIMRYCVANPTDPRCQTPGMRERLAGTGLSNLNYGGEDFGMNNAGQLAEEELGVDGGSAAAVAAKPKPVGDIGGMNKDAAAAKDIFSAPAAVQGGTGAIGSAGGGGGGASVSASANGLSKDPGVQGEKKDTPISVTKAGAAYDTAVGYAGGGWRAGGAKKEEASANPFAAMFGKDKGRDPASVPDIDSPASDLFTKISNRYGEVQKRKALMDVR